MPHPHALVNLIRGEQGSGKTNTLTGFIIDRALATIKAIQVPSGKLYPAEPYGGGKVLLPGGNGHEERIVSVPRNCIIIPEVKIFTNFHLFGVKYVYCTLSNIVEWVNDGTIRDGILGIDEAYIGGEARRSSSSINVQLTQFGQQIRKRKIELYMLVQHGRFLDWRWRWLATREITCRYDEKAHRVHLVIKNIRGNKQKTVWYDGSQYWPYFDTDELPRMPQKQVTKVAREYA